MLSSAQRLKPLHERFLPAGHVANAAAAPTATATTPRKRSVKKKPAPAPAAPRKRRAKITTLEQWDVVSAANPDGEPATPAASETSATANA
jgi:hypothetical protein